MTSPVADAATAVAANNQPIDDMATAATQLITSYVAAKQAVNDTASNATDIAANAAAQGAKVKELLGKLQAVLRST